MAYIYESYKYIFLLSILLIILMIVRWYLINKTLKGNLQISSCSTIGDEEIQEDYFGTQSNDQGTVAILADGLGKNKAGRISSIVAVKTIIDLFLKEGINGKTKYFFKKSFNTSNKEISKRIDNDSGGTSVLSTIIIENLLYYALVGDVLLAVYRNEELIRISEGHTLDVIAQKEFYKGNIMKEQALSALQNDKVLYYLGQEQLNNIEILKQPIKLQKGDIITLMTKGVYGLLPWTTLEYIIGLNMTTEQKVNKVIGEVNKDKTIKKNNGSIILIKYIGS